jgi:hypothetical protein
MKKLEELEQNIMTQSILCRSIERYCTLNEIKKYLGYFMLFIGLGLIPSYGSIILIIISLVFEGFATSNTNKSYKDLKLADKKLIELQVERSRLWTEMMATPTPGETARTN